MNKGEQMIISKIKYLSAILIGMLSVNAMAQQESSMIMYQYNMNIINPAYAGSTETMELAAMVRSQWVGIEGSPVTQTLSFSSPTILGRNMGIGVSVINDKFNIANETDLYIDFSYKLTLSRELDLYFGLKGGGSFLSVDKKSLEIIDPILSENINLFNPNFGTGIYLKTKEYYLSLSVPVLLQSKRYKDKENIVQTGSDKSHIYLAGGYTINSGNRNEFKLMPSFMVRYVSGAPISYGGCLTLSFLDSLEFGFSHRLRESTNLFGMFKVFNHFKIGYGHERGYSEISKFSNGSHEVILKYNF